MSKNVILTIPVTYGEIHLHKFFHYAYTRKFKSFC